MLHTLIDMSRVDKAISEKRNKNIFKSKIEFCLYYICINRRHKYFLSFTDSICKVKLQSKKKKWR